jgi:hypothetical protein
MRTINRNSTFTLSEALCSLCLCVGIFNTEYTKLTELHREKHADKRRSTLYNGAAVPCSGS